MVGRLVILRALMMVAVMAHRAVALMVVLKASLRAESMVTVTVASLGPMLAF